MGYKLSNFEKIKNDLELYKNAVAKIQNIKVKKQYDILLKDFIIQVDIIEQGHSSSSGGFMNPRNNRENIVRLIQIREQLNKLIKD